MNAAAEPISINKFDLGSEMSAAKWLSPAFHSLQHNFWLCLSWNSDKVITCGHDVLGWETQHNRFLCRKVLNALVFQC